MIIRGEAQCVFRCVIHRIGFLPYVRIPFPVLIFRVRSICLFFGLVGFSEVFASARQRSLSRAIVRWLGAEFTAQDPFCPSHHFQAGLLVSSGVGSVHALHVLLFRSHKPFAIGRSIGPIRMARRSCNYSSARCVGRVGVQRWGDAKEPD